MIDCGSYCNGISKSVVEALGLSTLRIPELRHVEWVNICGMLKITHKVHVPFIVNDYVDEVECDVLPLEVCGLLLGRPWQYDCNAIHAGRANTYSFMHDGKQWTLKPIRDDQIKSDVVLVVRKEMLHKAKPQPGLAKVQHEEHDTKSVSGYIVSAKHVDDKPVVLVSDKPVEVKPLIDEGKDMSACVPLPVRVDMGVQTDDGGADRVPVHMVSWVVSHSFLRTPRKRFAGAAVRCTKARMDVFVSCVAQALLLCRVVHRRFMFSSKELHQELRRRRWWHQSSSSYGEERRRQVLNQVKQAEREDVVWKASRT
jgi:hypothetical protein